MLFTIGFLVLLSTMTNGQGAAGGCTAGEFKCANKDKCLAEDKKCNLVDDCGDRSEEVKCVYCAKPFLLYSHCIKRETQQIMTISGAIFKNNYVSSKAAGSPALFPLRDGPYFDKLCGKTAGILKCIDDHNGKECDKDEMSINSLPFFKLYLPKICAEKKEYIALYKCLKDSPSDKVKRKKFHEDCTKKSLEEKKLKVPIKKNCADVPALKEIIKCAAKTVFNFDATCGCEAEVERKLYELDYGIPLLNCPGVEGPKDENKCDEKDENKEGDKKDENKEGDKKDENKDDRAEDGNKPPGVSGAMRVDGGWMVMTTMIFFCVLPYLSMGFIDLF